MKFLILLTLVASACSFAIGMNLSARQAMRQTTSVRSTSLPQSLPVTKRQNLDREVVREDKLTTNLQHPIAKPHIQIADESLPLSEWASETPIFNFPDPDTDPRNDTQETNTIGKTNKNFSKIFTVPTQFAGKIVEKMPISGEQKVIALTFDDGPWPKTTLQVLEILKKNNIKATFFWVGQCVKNFPKIAQQVVAEGHAIANHTWSHSYRKMSPSQAAKEIEDTAQLIYKTTKVKTSLFRPPGGLLNNGPADYAKRNNYAIIKWSNDPMDYRPLPANKLIKNVLRKAKSGDIVLMHDGGGNHTATVKALPEIIDKLRQQNFEFVTVPQLLEIENQEVNNPPL